MKKVNCILLLTLAILLVLSGCSSKGITGNADEVRISLLSQFPKDAVISKEKDYTAIDPKKVTFLFISSPSNSDLATLKHFTNLKYLRIDNFTVVNRGVTYDLSPLADLPLEGLSIDGYDTETTIAIKSLEPLVNIKSLAILSLTHCKIRSVDDLGRIKSLNKLEINDGNDIVIDDLSPLTKLIHLGEVTDAIIDAKDWKFAPYIGDLSEGTFTGLTINNGNDREDIIKIEQKIEENKIKSATQSPQKDLHTSENVESANRKNDADLYYFNTYSTRKTINNETLINVFLETFDASGKFAWDYSWENIRPTELSVSSDPVGYDNKIYIAVSGSLYCFDSKSGKLLWKNVKDIGGGAILYPYRDRIYLTSYYGNVLTCLDKDSGKKIWAIEDSNIFWGHDIFGQGDQIVAKYGDEGLLISANYLNGQIINQGYKGSMQDNKISWERARASSVLEDNQARYGPMNLIDNNFATAWAEGADGYGINQWIEIERDRPVDINRIEILNGYHKSQETYDNNGKLKKLRLDFSEGQYIYFDIDESKLSTNYINIYLNRPISTSSVKLTILDTYTGRKYQDTCITDIITY